MSAPGTLKRELQQLIEADGPITVACYMTLCLAHPVHGYYLKQDPLGASGDFTTAPEISQMFGELLGLWTIAVWQLAGAPAGALLVELGPGRGTLMADALRAARTVPAFRDAASVHLVETSPALRARQRGALASSGFPVGWHMDVSSLPDGPLFVIANEFFDALPVHQAIRMGGGWHERMVGVGDDGELRFGLAPDPIPEFEQNLPQNLRSAPAGSVFEWREHHVLAELCNRIVRSGGALLALDYGHAASGFGDTLQAVRRHQYADPLHEPGEADLTAHVDFEAMSAVARRCGARVAGPVTQGEFLRRIGIVARAERLKAAATEQQRADIDAALVRLTGAGSGEMGGLFKALAISHPAIDILPGFDG